MNIIFQCANVSPADINYDETISTLRYANRAKNIKNRARVNEDPKDALLRQFQVEIEELRKQLDENAAELTDSEGDSADGDSDEAAEGKSDKKLRRRSQIMTMEELGECDLDSSEKFDKAEKSHESTNDLDVHHLELKKTQ